MSQEPANNESPIYGTVYDDQDFKLVELSLMRYSNDSSWIKRSPVSRMEVYTQLKIASRGDVESYDFYFSWIVLDEAESSQRKLLKRISAPNTRNIRLYSLPVEKYLHGALRRMASKPTYTGGSHPKAKKKDRIGMKVRMPERKEFDAMLDGAFVNLKKQLGFPEVNPVEFRYEITREVRTAASDEGCKKYLDRCSTKDFIFQADFEKICMELKGKYKSDADNVIEALRKTRNRDHLAVFSISTENREIFVSMANELGQHIMMEGWKFAHLIEANNHAIRLHVFKRTRRNDPADLFVFNHNKEGEVVGKFNGMKSYIDIGCQDEEERDLKDRSTFIVDSTYVLCLYTMVSRLLKDRERFERLWNKAKTTNQVKDPFEMFPNALERKIQIKV